MINVQAKKENGHYKSFHINGHAMYAEAGSDIVCAAVSALVINTINSIEEFTDDPFTCDCRDGMIESWEFTNDLSAATELLMDSLMLGLTNRSICEKNRDQCCGTPHHCYDFYADGSPLGNLASGTGLADLHWKNCISCLCIYDSGRVFSYS